MDNNRFVNGFSSWQEVHFEMVSAIAIDLNKEVQESNVIIKRYEDQGTGGMYELAEELTNKFELKFKGQDWQELDYFDELENFINVELFK